MKRTQFKPSPHWLLAVVLAMLATLCFAISSARPQTPSGSSVTIEQQRQLDRLNQLSEQLRKDRDAVDAAAGTYGWDSNEADAAQQRLFQDRQQYRSLRRSLEVAGVSVPPDAGSGGKSNQATQSPRCCSHGHGHHGCCDGGHDCRGNGEDHCCHGRGD